MIVVPTEFHWPEIESYSISIEEIDWWSKQLWVEASGSKKAYAWIRLNLSYHDARGKIIRPTIMNNELLYWNLSKINSFFSGECGVCWNWWKDYPVLQEITGAIHLMVRSFSQVQKIVSVSGLLTDLAYILEYQKIRYINFKTYLNAMGFEARRLFLYLFTACKFLIFKNCFPLYRFERYQGASTYT